MNNQFNKRIDNISIIQNISHVVVCRAIKKFTSAIKVDPTYVRAYVCRGEAYHKIHEVGWNVVPIVFLSLHHRETLVSATLTGNWLSGKKWIVFNPFTAPACTVSGLKDGRMHLQTVYFPVIFWSCNTSTLNAMHFDKNPFTC